MGMFEPLDARGTTGAKVSIREKVNPLPNEFATVAEWTLREKRAMEQRIHELEEENRKLRER